jgi:hypothetical protein
MKQRVFIDVRLYDDNMRTIYNRHKVCADTAMKEVAKIMKTKIRGTK